VRLDLFGGEPHLLVIGDAETGKTSLLRLLVHDLVSRCTDGEVVFAVFDVRRTLLDVVPEDYLGAYAGTAAMASGIAGAVAGELQGRLPPDDVTAAQLRARSWWQGPEIVVLADDYDLLSPGGPGPLAPFVEFLPQARDLGFHMVVCRRSGGAGRAMYEPVPQRMREVGATGLLLSGDRQEGALFPGVSLSVQPPGRGHLVRRGRKPLLVQLASLPELPGG
jgi:S-DNA-T family DNA segregation ATPase FtsK/SpoIIIE